MNDIAQSVIEHLTQAKPWLKLVAVTIMPSLFLAFTVSEHYGLWDRVRGLNDVREVTRRMNTSYADEKRVYRKSDKEFGPTLALIRKYSSARIPSDREVLLIARYRAVVSYQESLSNGQVAEWTAPTTPLLLLYADPPGNGDVIQVGAIGDLYSWIEQSKSDFKFYVQSILLGVFSLVLGFLVWAVEHVLPRVKLKAAGGPV